MAPGMSRRASAVTVSRVFWRRPLPSAPSTSAIFSPAKVLLDFGRARRNRARSSGSRPHAVRRALRRGSSPRSGRCAPARPRPIWPARRIRAGCGATVVISAPAPKATAERMIAPTLCGSVTWSSTSTSRASPSADEPLRPQRLGLDDDALVHGLAAGDAVDRTRLDEFGREGQGGEVGDAQPLHGVAGDQHAADLAARIVERGAHRMDAVEPHQPAVAGRGQAAPARAPACSGGGAARLLVAVGAPAAWRNGCPWACAVFLSSVIAAL